VKRHPSLRVVVIGGGYVGLITAVGLSELGHRVHLVEIRPDRLDLIRRGEAPIFEADLPGSLARVVADGLLTASGESPGDADVALICVGTPIGPDGRSHLDQLETALRTQAPKLRPGVPLVIRSTLPPGSTRLAVEWSGVPSSRVFTNPEFLRQGSALADFRRPSRIVIGRFADADPASSCRSRTRSPR
jgi:UDPglucose 6-dehydrogenase